MSKAGLVNDVRELPVKNVNDEGKSRGYSGRQRGAGGLTRQCVWRDVQTNPRRLIESRVRTDKERKPSEKT